MSLHRHIGERMEAEEFDDTWNEEDWEEEEEEEEETEEEW